MKNLIRASLLGVFLISIAFNLASFTLNNTETTVDEHILVEIYEVPDYVDKGIHIHYGGEKTELVRFLDFDTENHSKNGDIIIQTINRLERDGYDLTHVSSGLATNGMITKVWMVKRR